MLIHKQDNLVIDLERNKDMQFKWKFEWDGFSLMLSLQVNGKLARSSQTIFVYTWEQMNELHPDNTGNVGRTNEAHIIDDYKGIYAVLDYINDLWYNIKENEQDYSYRWILPKIHEAINSYYSKD